MDAVDELAVRQHEKQRQHEREMPDEERRHEAASAKHEQQESGAAREEEHRDERRVQALLRRIAERRVADAPHREETRRADQEPSPPAVPSRTGRLVNAYGARQPKTT